MIDNSYRSAWQLMAYHVGLTATGARPARLMPSDDIDWTKYLSLADGHLVSCQLGAALDDNALTFNTPDLVRRYLTAKFVLNKAQCAQIYTQINEVAAALNAIGTEPTVMKGAAHLLTGLYPKPGARVMGDIDLVVSKEAFATCTTALLDLGYTIGSEGSAWLNGQDYIAFFDPTKPVWIDMHVAPLMDRYANLLNTSELTSASQSHRFTDGARAQVPCPTHAMLIAIAHAQLHDRSHTLGVLPLRSMADLEILLSKHAEQIDWSSLIGRFSAPGTSRALAAHLRVYESIFQGRPTNQIDLGYYSQFALRKGEFFIGRPRWQSWNYSLVRRADPFRYRRKFARVYNMLTDTFGRASGSTGT